MPSARPPERDWAAEPLSGLLDHIERTHHAYTREAIGQLLEYAFWPGAHEPARFIVVGESPIDEDGHEYLRRLKKRLSLPSEYEAIVI